MKISLSDVGKRFNRDWIFRKLSFDFITGQSYAITGPNGSGKSTLLQVIASAIVASEGELKYYLDSGLHAPRSAFRNLKPETRNTEHEITHDQVYQYISIAAPYLELIEEMTAIELLGFHQKFKAFLPSTGINKIIAAVGLESAAKKQIRYYSSGMKQRLKLAQAIFSDVPCVLLDEPCTNLDDEGIGLYQGLLNDYCKNRLVIVSSNDKVEHGFCKEVINIMKFKV